MTDPVDALSQAARWADEEGVWPDYEIPAKLYEQKCRDFIAQVVRVYLTARLEEMQTRTRFVVLAPDAIVDSSELLSALLPGEPNK